MKRHPIVTVMGHVDHGKTTLLDALRNTNVVDKESGGITQHTGASQISYKDHKITFIDTPGHEAFSEMRSRGGKIADIVVLVVAANEGVKPQTKEAIAHAKFAKIPIIVAITKTDLPETNIQMLKSQLNKEGIILEEFGGDVICVEVSAHKKLNLDKLLDSILAVSDLVENTDSDEGDLKGFVLESRHDPRRGYTTSLIITNGTLKVGDEILVANRIKGKIRAILDFQGKNIPHIKAGDPGEILGLKEMAHPGEIIEIFKGAELDAKPERVVNVEGEYVLKIKGNLTVIVRADTEGTMEAIVSSLEKLKYEERIVEIVLKGVGEIKESDILLASASNSIVLAFKVGIPSIVSEKARHANVIVRKYDIIYELIEEVEGALEGMQEILEEKIKGRAEILKVFPLPSGDVVAGCKVIHGRLRVGDSISIREGIAADSEIFKSKIKNIKKGKESVNTMGKGTECGILLSGGHERLKENLMVEVL